MRAASILVILTLALFDVRVAVAASGAAHGAPAATEPTASAAASAPLHYGDATDVIDVASSAAFDALLAVDAPLLVHAYTPWSAACKTLRPTLIEAAALLRGKVPAHHQLMSRVFFFVSMYLNQVCMRRML